MSENLKTLFHVGVSKSVDQIKLQNVLNELKSRGILIGLKDTSTETFTIEQLLTNEEIETVGIIFHKYGVGNSGHHI